MDSETLMIFLVSLGCLIVIDAIIIFDLYVVWIKKKRIEMEVAKWRGTRKPLYWFLSWSGAFLSNIVVFVLISCISGEPEWVAFACLISVVLSLVFFIAYHITYNIIKDKN